MSILTIASWPAYRFLKRQVRWSGIPISLRTFHSLWWSTQSKESWTIRKAECRRTDAFELLEKTLKSPLDYKEIQPVYPKANESCIFTGRTDAEAETPIFWPPDAKNWLIGKKTPWCWERVKIGGEGDDRGWDGWMAPLTQWTWVWVNSGSWWWAGRPGVLQSMGSQGVGHDWATELNLRSYESGHLRHCFPGFTVDKSKVPHNTGKTGLITP